MFRVGLGIVAALCSAAIVAAEVEVKLSRSGLCHSLGSSHYHRTTHYTPYESLEACLAAGGQLPKGRQEKANKTAPAGKSRYSRDQFGHGWQDFDNDCQNTRMEILIARSTSPVRFKDTGNCQVHSGRWISPFTGEVLVSASDVHIDHLVPQKWAWVNGAKSWPLSRRVAFANDPANLLVIEASLNRQKGAKGLATWLPPSNQCAYILRFIRIAKRYQLQLPNSYLAVKRKYCD